MHAQARTLSHFSNNDVQHVFKKAVLRLTQDGLLFILAPRTKEYGRILAITPRKSGNAPTRNRIRRQLKAIFYTKKMYEAPFDILVRVTPEGIRQKSGTLEKLLTTAIAAAHKKISHA